MTPNDVRSEQITEGRIRSTLSARPGYDRPKSPSAPRKPFIAKGHDAILKGMQDVGGYIRITTMGDGTTHFGKMVARDKFTITVETVGGERITFYKHAIESFSPATVESA